MWCPLLIALFLISATSIQSDAKCVPSHLEASTDEKSYSNYEKEIEKFHPEVQQMLKDMSIAEKIGQMTQIDIQWMLKPNSLELDEELVHSLVNKYFIGSVLNSPFSGGKIAGVSCYDSLQWRELITKLQNIFLNEGSKVPMIFGLDSVHGATYVRGATFFPQPINAAASFSHELARSMGHITAKDTRQVGIPWIFAPILGPSVEPRWPRVFETFGEDPLVASVLGVAMIHGAQGYSQEMPHNLTSQNAAAACMKHFVGYPAPRSGHDRTPSWIPERFLHQYFVPAFKAAVEKGHVVTTMESYNEINGIPVASSHEFLVGLLRNNLGFEGLLVTDYHEIENLYSWHKIVDSVENATFMAMNRTSIDMSMVAQDLSFPTDLLKLVQNGRIPESRIDVSAGRILNLKKSLGLWEHPLPPTTPPTAGCTADRAEALAMARESIVLLKNDKNLLPLDKEKYKKILVAGPSGNSLKFQSGGWTIHWQGALDDSEFSFGKTFYEGIQEAFPESHVTYSQGCPIEGPCDPSELNATVALGKESDVIVLCVGEKNYAEKPGNLKKDLTLEEGQVELLYRLKALGIPTVLVLIEGRPRVIPGGTEGIDAAFMAFLPGPEGGQAMGEILSGEVNPSGKMPITYPRYTVDVPVQYYHKPSAADIYDPLFAFGDGLSYTTFEYSDLRFGQMSNELMSNETLQVNVTVRNSGNREGKETVLMFVSDLYRTITPEVKMLRNFTKISLKPNESQTVSFVITPWEDLSFFGRSNLLELEGGHFNVTIGPLMSTFKLNLIDSSSQSHVEDGGPSRTLAKFFSLTFVFGMTCGMLMVFAGCQISKKSRRAYSPVGQSL